jgi:hypothetical protein
MYTKSQKNYSADELSAVSAVSFFSTASAASVFAVASAIFFSSSSISQVSQKFFSSIANNIKVSSREK